MIMMTVSHLPWSKRATVYRVRSVQTERFLGQLGCSRDDWNMFHVDIFKDCFISRSTCPLKKKHRFTLLSLLLYFYLHFCSNVCTFIYYQECTWTWMIPLTSWAKPSRHQRHDTTSQAAALRAWLEEELLQDGKVYIYERYLWGYIWDRMGNIGNCYAYNICICILYK